MNTSQNLNAPRTTKMISRIPFHHEITYLHKHLRISRFNSDQRKPNHTIAREPMIEKKKSMSTDTLRNTSGYDKRNYTATRKRQCPVQPLSLPPPDAQRITIRRILLHAAVPEGNTQFILHMLHMTIRDVRSHCLQRHHHPFNIVIPPMNKSGGVCFVLFPLPCPYATPSLNTTGQCAA